MLEVPLLDAYNHTLAKTEEERKRLSGINETHSPQSWGSFNMLGAFDFSDEKLQDTTSVLGLIGRFVSRSTLSRIEEGT